MKIAVYCSANNDVAREYFEVARQLGVWMAEAGHTLIWGGGSTGLMGAVGDSFHDNGGRTIGMVPTALERTNRVSDNIDVYIPCDSLSDRKDLMLAHADISIALPGGIGTLDEIFGQAGSNTIGFHSKKVILYNIGGFWDPLIALLDYLQKEKMVRGHWSDLILVADSLGDIQKLISE